MSGQNRLQLPSITQTRTRRRRLPTLLRLPAPHLASRPRISDVRPRRQLPIVRRLSRQRRSGTIPRAPTPDPTFQRTRRRAPKRQRLQKALQKARHNQIGYCELPLFCNHMHTRSIANDTSSPTQIGTHAKFQLYPNGRPASWNVFSIIRNGP